MSRELDDIDGASSGAGTTSNPFKSLMAASTTTTTSSSFNGSAASTATSSTSPFKTGGGGGFGSISRASGGRFGTITPELFQAMSTGSATSTSSSGSSTSTSTSTPSQRSSTTGQRQTLSPGTAKQDEQQLEREKELLSAYEQVLDTPPTTEAYELLRSLVFVAGIPAYEMHTALEGGFETLRGRVWKALLRVDIDGAAYLESLAAAREALADPSHPLYNTFYSMYAGIANDANRTTGAWDKAEPELQPNITKRVTVSALVRLFLAFAHQTLDWEPRPSYAQGMNSMAGLLLYTMCEVDAFYCFLRIYQWHIRPYSVLDYRMKKVSTKMALICLSLVDRDLFKSAGKLLAENLELLAPLTEYYHASSAPLSRVLALWDCLLAFGMHLSVVFAVTRIVNMRERFKAIKKQTELIQIVAANQLPPLEEPKISLDLLVPMLKDLSKEFILESLWYHLRDPAQAIPFIEKKLAEQLSLI